MKHPHQPDATAHWHEAAQVRLSRMSAMLAVSEVPGVTRGISCPERSPFPEVSNRRNVAWVWLLWSEVSRRAGIRPVACPGRPAPAAAGGAGPTRGAALPG